MPEPLHPAIVHLPLGLAVVMPIVTLLALIAMARRFLASRAWWTVVVLQGILAGSALFASETGEDQQDAVKTVVPAALVDAHQQRGNIFVRLCALTLVCAGVGLLDRRTGRWGRALTLPFTLAVFVFAILTGKSGGELVYRHGAAAVYVETVSGSAPAPK